MLRALGKSRMQEQMCNINREMETLRIKENARR